MERWVFVMVKAVLTQNDHVLFKAAGLLIAAGSSLETDRARTNLCTLRDLLLTPAPQTCSSDLLLTPAPQTCPSDLPLRPAPQTCSSDLPLRPAPQTCPSDLPLRPAPQTFSSDLLSSVSTEDSRLIIGLAKAFADWRNGANSFSGGTTITEGPSRARCMNDQSAQPELLGHSIKSPLTERWDGELAGGSRADHVTRPPPATPPKAAHGFGPKTADCWAPNPMNGKLQRLSRYAFVQVLRFLCEIDFHAASIRTTKNPELSSLFLL
ncbi:unnamed protein product [Arctogadus glacialis]